MLTRAGDELSARPTYSSYIEPAGMPSLANTEYTQSYGTGGIEPARDGSIIVDYIADAPNVAE